MGAKKVVEFLILRSVMTKKNFSSIGLVAMFFGIYVILGGKVVWVPKVDERASFGSAEQKGEQAAQQTVGAPENTGTAAPAAKALSPAEELRRGRLADKPAAVAPEQEKARAAADAEWKRLEERLGKLKQEKQQEEEKVEESSQEGEVRQ